ncbi:MAG: hypothetical protein IKU22_09540 [Alistipes sp.]|nr:hypothetical protein [Alistipes sp.]
MGAKSKDQIRNQIASLQANIASMKAQLPNKDANAKAALRNNIAIAQGRLAQLKADLKNAK